MDYIIREIKRKNMIYSMTFCIMQFIFQTVLSHHLNQSLTAQN